jgi:hypothetical protein
MFITILEPFWIAFSDDQWMFHRKTSSSLFNLTKFKGSILDTCKWSKTDITFLQRLNTVNCVVCVAVNDHCATVVEIIKNYGGKPFDIHVSVSAP